MPVNAVKARPGWTFWLAIIWLTIVVVSAAMVGRWAMPTFDAMDWDNPGAAPRTRNDSVILQNAGETEKNDYVYWLGTDTMGRDVISRLIYGARVSLAVGFLSPVFGFFLGGFLGCLAGYFRGRLEALIVAVMDVILAFPGIVLLLASTFYLGPSLRNLVVALGFLTIPAFSRVARAKVLTFRDLEFVEAARDRAVELLKKVGIPMAEIRFDQHPHQLSGGLRQRVAIALACEPKLLIADELTCALDVAVQTEILDLLATLLAEKRMAMILVSHDLWVVAGRTHETVVMYAGKIVEQAPTADLFKKTAMPYTRALLDAILRLTDPPHTTLRAIGGHPTDLIDPPSGCRFAPRCARAAEICWQQEPVLKCHLRPRPLMVAASATSGDNC
jgi:oligopeptide/dipeptide ABC transporter ATP-binding protein